MSTTWLYQQGGTSSFYTTDGRSWYKADGNAWGYQSGRWIYATSGGAVLGFFSGDWFYGNDGNTYYRSPRGSQ